MEIIHITAECYPVAKAGGLGDVVGALPKYINELGHIAKVVMPMYRTKFLYQNEWVVDFKGYSRLGDWQFEFTVIKEKINKLGFDLYLIDINGLLDREKIYGYEDDAQRFTAFQIAVLTWINQWEHQPDVIHCHDHHTGLIPFMMKHCYAFQQKLSNVPSVITIHNAQYQGWMGWDKSIWIPEWDLWKRGELDWNNTINPLASGIKCAWKVTTVSWSYLDELKQEANGLEALFEYEKGKCIGILNGIDAAVWNPSTDPFIIQNYDVDNCAEGKHLNKKHICKKFNLDIEKPLVVFIGRLVGEKAADVLPEAIKAASYGLQGKVNFMILGSGEPEIEWKLKSMISTYPGIYNAYLGYDEILSHILYAGADFLLMPSRVEPCGLNQMYAMRYGTMPMVRSTGGLKDTVVDMGDENGFGIRFNHATVEDIYHALTRAVTLYYDYPEKLLQMQQSMMQKDHSWTSSVQNYINLYQSLK